MNLYLENIQLSYGKQLFNYDMHLTEGMVGVFGPSGSGKTTLMNIISGLAKPAQGKVVFNGRLFFDANSKLNVPPNKRSVGVVFQDHNLFPHMTVLKNLKYSKPYHSKANRKITFEKVLGLLELEPLLPKTPVQLSGGERQRVAIGRTLLSQPQLLLLDEPFSNLDRFRRKQIISYLLRINSQFDIPMMIISHDLEDILKLAKHFVIIDQGKLLKQGHYLDIISSSQVSHILSHKRFLNVFDLFESSYHKEEGLHGFSCDRNDGKEILKTWCKGFKNRELGFRKVRFCIFPDDIALSKNVLKDVSVQNQIKGSVTDVYHENGSSFVRLDCGIKLVAEITPVACKQMNIRKGQELFAVLKSKAIEVVHIYEL